MRRIFTIARLTWKAAFRFRLFWVLAVLLLGSVVALPLLLKDDGTARGFTQILLTYTLGMITTLLGFSTLWLSCGTLARDIEECQMQVVVVKPIARWQIWLGKWLGIVMLNAALLTLSGASVYGVLQWRARQLPPEQREILRTEIFTARASLKEPLPNLDDAVDLEIKKIPDFASMSAEQQAQTRQQLRERIQAFYQVVMPGHYRRWFIDFGFRKHLIGNQPLFLRVKFYVAQTNLTGQYLGLWRIGTYTNPVAVSMPQSLSANTFHELRLEGGSRFLDESGQLIVNFENRNDTALVFPLDEGLEVLYREGGFGLNFTRGLGIILCWLALLSAVGLAAASLLSFPVAAFFSVSLLVVALSSGTLASVVSEGTVIGVDHEGENTSPKLLDTVLLPLFKGLLAVVRVVEMFSPVEALSSGRSITWGLLGQAFAQVVLLMGGLFALAGIVIFTRRELATAQGTS
jgi:hypothetical protein